MEYQLPVDLEDRFIIVSAFVAETARYAFETLMWSEGVSEGSELDDSVVTAVHLAVSDFLNNPSVYEVIRLTGMSSEFIGHNLFLSGNRHGAGFWDSTWAGASKEQLDLLHTYSPALEVYAGDDQVYYAN